MKAEKYGTMAEQSRYRMGYLQPSMVEKKNFNRCRNCLNGVRNMSGQLRCVLISFAVASGGCCDHYKPEDPAGRPD